MLVRLRTVLLERKRLSPPCPTKTGPDIATDIRKDRDGVLQAQWYPAPRWPKEAARQRQRQAGENEGNPLDQQTEHALACGAGRCCHSPCARLRFRLEITLPPDLRARAHER